MTTINPPAIGPHSKIVGQNIRAFRRFNGWSMRDLVQQLVDVGYPMHPGSLQRLEVGQRRVDVDDLVALSAIFNVSAEQMLTSDVKNMYGLPGTYAVPIDDDDEEEEL